MKFRDRLPAIRSFDRLRAGPCRSPAGAGFGWISLCEIQWRRWDVERPKRGARWKDSRTTRRDRLKTLRADLDAAGFGGFIFVGGCFGAEGTR
ncbi:MAG: hypothetical protein RI897_4474, partial [Verrucomicrobiota bacterium]